MDKETGSDGNAFNPSNREAETGRSEFKANLIHRASSTTAKAI